MDEDDRKSATFSLSPRKSSRRHLGSEQCFNSSEVS